MSTENSLPIGHNPLVLAYIGDAVFELFIRGHAILGYSDTAGNNPVSANTLHRYSTRYVKASAQALMLHRIAETLTPEESDIVRRGRNANPSNIPKHADVADYRHATGFEALLGYLYLKKDLDRLEAIMDAALSSMQKEKDDQLERRTSR